jgi:hypothetical protein
VASTSATDGTRTLSVSQAASLSGEGQRVTVSGSGYDVGKGIYVALCVATPKGVLPSPCGGGVDMEGDGGASVWISDNPPSYATGLTIPYGPGGSFRVNFTVGPIINSVTDCRVVACAIVTKNDHTINNDRSQDLQIPVTFTGTPVATVPVTTTTVTSARTPGESTSGASVPGTVAPTASDASTPVVDAADAESTPTTLVAGSDDTTSTIAEPVTEITVTDNVDDLIAVATAGETSSPLVPVMLGIGALLVVAGAVVAINRRKR